MVGQRGRGVRRQRHLDAAVGNDNLRVLETPRQQRPEPGGQVDAPQRDTRGIADRHLIEGDSEPRHERRAHIADPYGLPQPAG